MRLAATLVACSILSICAPTERIALAADSAADGAAEPHGEGGPGAAAPVELGKTSFGPNCFVETPADPADPDVTHATSTDAEPAHAEAEKHDGAEADPADASSNEPLPGDSLLADGGPDEPYKLVRTLEIVQDQIAAGSEDAHSNQRELIRQIETKILAAPDEVWRKPRNARAAIIYGLSGGDSKIFDKLLKIGPLPCLSDDLLKGLSAYGQGLNETAKSLLGDLDPLTVGERAGAHLALAEAMLVAGEKPNRAIELLDLVRLLAPGTLLEEAALRRESVIAALMEELPKFEMLTSQYLRRFDKSIYASEFISRFAVAVSTTRYSTSEPDFQRLAATIDHLDRDARLTLYLALTQAAIVRGKIMLTRSGANKLSELASGDPALAIQAELYKGAAMLLTDKYDEAAALLRAIDRRALPEKERPLLDAALELAVRLRMPPQVDGPITSPPPVSAEQGPERTFDSMDQVIANAKQMIGSADELLAGEKR